MSDPLHAFRGSIQTVRNLVFTARRSQASGELDVEHPLASLETALSAIENPREETDPSAILKHDLRNILSVLRNASAYLVRQVQSSPVWTERPKVPEFFEILDEQITRVETLVARK